MYMKNNFNVRLRTVAGVRVRIYTQIFFQKVLLSEVLLITE